MRSVAELIDLFRQAGHKLTPQRRVIFDLLSADDSHPTAEDVYRRALAVLPDISRTTVYNTLRELVELGELIEVEEMNEGGTRYDTSTGPHHHLLCLNCHTLSDIHREFDGLELAAEEAGGYRIVRRQVTFYGYCPACQAKMSAPET